MDKITVVAKKEFADPYLSFSLTGGEVYRCTPDASEDTVKQYKTDIIILDCGFEVGDGLQLLKDLKSSQPGTPIIFVTDIASEDIVLKAFKTGARDFFKKPVSMAELQETVKGILAAKRMSKESRNPFIKDSAFSSGMLADKLSPGHAIDFHNAIRYIEENLSDVICLDDIAKRANVSKYHFCRIFKAHAGMSPLRFVTFMRIEKAKELLKKDDLNISMAAATVGFNDISSFIKQFKSLTGMTPSSYRKSLK